MSAGVVWAAKAPVAQKVQPAEAYFHYSLGLQARMAGNAESALDELRQAKGFDPTSGEVRAEIARTLKELGKIDEAKTEAREAVRVAPQSAQAHLTLARLYRLDLSGADSEQARAQAIAAFESALKIETNNAEAWLELVDLHRRGRDDERAAFALEKYIALNPTQSQALLELGQHYLALRATDKAADAFKRAIAAAPGSAQAYQSLGDIYAQAQEIDQAVLHYRKAVELDPQNLLLRLSLANTLMQGERPSEALTEAEAALGSDQKNRYALEIKAQALRDLKRLDDAMAIADQLLAQNASDLAAQDLKIGIFEARDDFTSAAAALETVLARNRKGENPDLTQRYDRRFWLHLGYAYMELTRPADAATAFGRAKAITPEPEAEMYIFEIEALLRAKKNEDALAAVRAARVKFPDKAELIALEAIIARACGDHAAGDALIRDLSARAQAKQDVAQWLLVADYYRRAKHYAQAADALAQARPSEPRNWKLAFQLGAMLERQKRYDEAEVVFREALRLKPDSAQILNYLGYMNANRGVRVEEAVTLIERALTIDPDNGAYLDSLGWALYRLGRLADAERRARAAAGKQANAVILDHLGDILDKQGKTGEALECWQRALTSEDEDEELDRPRVEAKIEEAKRRLAR
ncbi:MAG: tetratricopeptide repeat protein [Vicinamibacteria bacterium]|nr:tetratricopeptide repeat protein [Vicinamibacteria bacterium]